jgi:hypothetical protein
MALTSLKTGARLRGGHKFDIMCSGVLLVGSVPGLPKHEK